MVFPSLSSARYRYAHLLRTLMDVSSMRQLAERGRRHCSSFTPKFATEPSSDDGHAPPVVRSHHQPNLTVMGEPGVQHRAAAAAGR